MNAIELAFIIILIGGIIFAFICGWIDEIWPMSIPIGVVIGLLIAGWNGINDTYSDGVRVGTIVKLSYKGMFYKSWEGELLVTANAVNGAGAGYTFEFNVNDPQIIGTLQLAMLTGRRVQLHYHQWWLTPVRIDGDHVIDKVNDTK